MWTVKASKICKHVQLVVSNCVTSLSDKYIIHQVGTSEQMFQTTRHLYIEIFVQMLPLDEDLAYLSLFGDTQLLTTEIVCAWNSFFKNCLYMHFKVLIDSFTYLNVGVWPVQKQIVTLNMHV